MSRSELGVNPHPGRPTWWSSADEAFEFFLGTLEVDANRRRRLTYEMRKPIPIKDALARRFEDETEQLRRVIAVERARWFAEQRRNAS